MQGFQSRRLPLMALAMVILVGAVWAGLVRLGWHIPMIGSHLPLNHGPLMVSGFLGTLVSLERAVALRRPWMYAAPVLAGLGGLVLLVGTPHLMVGAVLITAGSAVLAALFIGLLKREQTLFNGVLLAAALLWLGGNGLWLFGFSISILASWWAGFLILTIAGERLELSRILLPPATVQAGFAAAVAIFIGGLIVTPFSLLWGWRIWGVAMVAMAIWLLRYDIARFTVRKTELPRFMAMCMLAGYFWLGFAGILAATWGFVDGAVYDAMLHAIFLGFVFSMIFAHAPIILPAVMGVAIPYHAAFYLHLIALHLSLLLRVAGDLGGWADLRRWGGMLNAITLLLFVLNTIAAARSRQR